MSLRPRAAPAPATGRRWVVPAFLLLALLPGARPAAAANGAWQTFLRSGEINDLLPLDGEIWCTTSQGGLLRFDRGSERFDIIRREPGSIASNRLTRIVADGSGRLWVGTNGQGASRRSANGGLWSPVNVLDGLPSDSVTVLEPQADTLWIGTRRGVALWNGREIAGALPDAVTTSFDTTFTLPAVTGVAAIGDSLFLSTPRGVGVARISQILRDWAPVNQGLSNLEVRALASDSTDLFALAGGDLLRFRFDLGAWEPSGLAGPVLQLSDRGGEVLGANGAGIFAWRTGPGWQRVGDPIAPGARGEAPVMAGDPLGGVVVARAETLYVESPIGPTRRALVVPDGPTDNDLVSVVVEGPRVYTTTFFRGMGRYDGATWTHWRDDCVGTCDTTLVRPRTAFGLMVDREGHKWVGGWIPADPAAVGVEGTLTEIDDSQSPPRFIHHERVTESSPLALKQRTWMLLGVADARGRHWLATDTPAAGDVDPIGLLQYDSTGTFVEALNPGNSNMSGLFLHGIGVTRNGRVWLGFDGQGVDYFLPPATADGFVHLNRTDGYSVRGVATYGDSVWILAADQSQLQLFDEGVNLDSRPAKVVLSCPQTFLGAKPLAVGPEGRVWVATPTGLKTLAYGETSRIDSFTVANSPLPDNEVRSVAVEPSGAVWITTAGGLARFDPGYVPPAPPRLERLQIRVYPNPGTITTLGVSLRLTGEGESYRGTIHDLSGRRLRSFSGLANGARVWDGRDDQGRVVKPGIYFIRVEAGGRSSVARVALFR